MFSQVHLSKCASPEYTEQLIIAKLLAHTVSHTRVLSKMEGREKRRDASPGTPEAFDRRLHHMITRLESYWIDADKSAFSWMRCRRQPLRKNADFFLFPWLAHRDATPGRTSSMACLGRWTWAAMPRRSVAREGVMILRADAINRVPTGSLRSQTCLILPEQELTAQPARRALEEQESYLDDSN